MTLIEFWRLLKRYRWLMLATTLFVPAVVMVQTSYVVPSYAAQVVMNITNVDNGLGLSARLGQLGGVLGLAGLGGDRAADRFGALAVLRSRRLVEEFIQDQELLPVLFPDRWDPDTKQWAESSPNRKPSLQDGYKLFDEKVRSVTEDQKTGLVTLEIRWYDRDQAARWANALVSRANQTLRQKAIAEAERNLTYLNGQLETTNLIELRQSIFQLIEQNTSKVMMAKGREDYAFTVIDPAVVPDADKYVSPRRILRLGLGFVLGFLLGLIIAFSRHILQQEQLRALSSDVQRV